MRVKASPREVGLAVNSVSDLGCVQKVLGSLFWFNFCRQFICLGIWVVYPLELLCLISFILFHTIFACLVEHSYIFLPLYLWVSVCLRH